MDAGAGADPLGFAVQLHLRRIDEVDQAALGAHRKHTPPGARRNGPNRQRHAACAGQQPLQRCAARGGRCGGGVWIELIAAVHGICPEAGENKFGKF